LADGLHHRQRCATDLPLLLNAYRYGGLAFAHGQWHNQNSDYLTSEGKTRANGDGTARVGAMCLETPATAWKACSS